MRTIIYYFSATGNSLVVAKDLAAELGNAALAPITKTLTSGQDVGCDTVGIVFPVYMFGLPLVVARFLAALPVSKDAYIFTVATFGGLPGLPHTMAREIFRERDIRVAAGFSVLMPGNYTPMYGAIGQEKQSKMFAAEKLRVKDIARLVRARAKNISEEKPFLPNFLLHHLLYRGGSKMIPQADRDFWVTDACVRCGTCAKVCPVANIEMRQGLPVWLHHCEHCMACLQWCPPAAIEYKKSTAGRKRYHHPDVKAQDIMAQRWREPTEEKEEET